MDRFRFDDDDEQDEDFDMDDFLEETPIIDEAQIAMVERDQNQRLLQDTINFLSKSFFWRFRKTETKLKMINETYHEFISLIDVFKKE